VGEFWGSLETIFSAVIYCRTFSRRIPLFNNLRQVLELCHDANEDNTLEELTLISMIEMKLYKARGLFNSEEDFEQGGDGHSDVTGGPQSKKAKPSIPSIFDALQRSRRR